MISTIPQFMHTTTHELKFLDHLGTFGTISYNRRVLLERYRESMRLRRDWGHIDTREVRAHVDHLLERYR